MCPQTLDFGRKLAALVSTMLDTASQARAIQTAEFSRDSTWLRSDAMAVLTADVREPMSETAGAAPGRPGP